MIGHLYVSVTLFRARKLLRDFKKLIDDRICKLCKEENEDIQHFILECSALRATRKTITGLKRQYNEHADNIITKILLFGKTEEIITRNKEDLYKL